MLPAPRLAALRPNRPSTDSDTCGVSVSLCGIVRVDRSSWAGSATQSR